MKQPVKQKERIYVKVTSDFDATGYMQPKVITWSDGRVFPIESIKDFRPAGTEHDSMSTDCYTIVVNGEIKHLFYERSNQYRRSSVGRWYVERMVRA